jgi:FkbM family methyltransferase
LNNVIKRAAYFLLNLVTGNKGVRRTINRFKVRFPARWSRYYQSGYEEGNYNFLREKVKPGMHIIDIGAHLGLFSVASSQLAGDTGKVVCFEPTPGTYAILLQTLQLNHCSNVVPVMGAVGNKEGAAVFYISETVACNSNSLVKNIPGKSAKENEVKMFTIDGAVHRYLLKPGVIKIDAEGAELDVLEGGVNAFRQYKPILILGLHPQFISEKGDSLEKIWDLLQQSGYQVREDNNNLTRTDFCSRELLFDVHCI